MEFSSASSGQSGSLYRLERGSAATEHPLHRLQHALSDPAWVQVPHLASHILGKVTRTLSEDWNRMYGHPVYFAETFIDPGRFRGTCYRAANWQLLGLTTGRGKIDHTNKPNRPIKQILGLPLTRGSESCSASDDDETTSRGKPGRTGSDHRSRHARAAERIGRPEAESRDPCHGRETGAETEYGENQRRSAADATPAAIRRAANPLRPATDAMAPLRLPAPAGFVSRTPRFTPVTAVQSA